MSNQVLDKKDLPEIIKKFQTTIVDLDFLLKLPDDEIKTLLECNYRLGNNH